MITGHCETDWCSKFPHFFSHWFVIIKIISWMNLYCSALWLHSASFNGQLKGGPRSRTDCMSSSNWDSLTLYFKIFPPCEVEPWVVLLKKSTFSKYWLFMKCLLQANDSLSACMPYSSRTSWARRILSGLERAFLDRIMCNFVSEIPMNYQHRSGKKGALN